MSRSHIFRAQSIGASDAQALNHTVRHNRQRLAVAGAEQKNESDEFLARCGSLLVLSNSPCSSAPLDHVGIEADRRDLELRDHPVHGLEDVASIVVKRSVDIAARSADRSAFAQLTVSLVQLRQTLSHRQQLRNLIIVQDDRHFYASVPFLAQFERRSLGVGALIAATCPRHRACTHARTSSSAVHRDLKDQAGYPHAGHSTAGLLMSAPEGPDIRQSPLRVESSSAPNHPGRRRPCAASTSGCAGERVSAVLDRLSVQRRAKRMILCLTGRSGVNLRQTRMSPETPTRRSKRCRNQAPREWRKPSPRQGHATPLLTELRPHFTSQRMTL